MYVRINQGLGQDMMLTGVEPTNIFCSRPPNHIVGRKLKVRFRRSFQDFLREVERAVGRWTVFRSDPGHRRVKRLVQPWEDILRRIHKSNLDAGISPGTQVEIASEFFYRGEGENSRVCGVGLYIPPSPEELELFK